jgi:hypothetical protein
MKEQNKSYENEVRVCIAIQKIGKATAEEIKEKLEEEEIKLTLKQIQKACNNLQKRGIISLGYDSSSGYAVKSYNMSKSIFSRDIPIAHYKDIVDTNDPEIKKLISELEEKKLTSKGKLPDIRDYYICEVKFEVVDKILGFMPFEEEGFNQHYKLNNEIVLLPTHFRAWLSVNMRAINKSESLARNYIGYNYGYVKLKGKTEIVQFPVLDQHQGRGIVKYEVIPSGSIISTKFRIPKTEFTPEAFKSFLIDIGEMPIKGLSGRAMTGYGHLKVNEFNVI